MSEEKISLRVAIWGRVSTGTQEKEGLSLDDQMERLRAWVKENGHICAAEFKEAITAYHKRGPKFEKMVAELLSDERPYDAVAYLRQSRFYRDNYRREGLSRELAKRRIVEFCIDEPLPDDEKSRHLIVNIKGLVDQHQSWENSKAVTSCMRKNFSDGYYNGGANTPFGYTTYATDLPSRSGVKKKLIINPDEEQIAKKIFEMVAYGHQGNPIGLKKIASLLNERNILRRGQLWKTQGILDMVHNTCYVGENVWFKKNTKTRTERKPTEWVTSQVPAIIDKSLFEAATKALETRSIRKTEAKAELSETLLTGLLKCGHCGKGLVLMTGKSGRYKYYRCATKKKSSVKLCKCPNIPLEPLDDLVLNILATDLLTDAKITSMVTMLREALAAKLKPAKARLLGLQKKQQALKLAIEVLYDQISSQMIKPDDHFYEYLNKKKRELLSVEQEISQTKSELAFPVKKFGAAQIAAFCSAARDALRAGGALAKGFLRLLVERIVVQETQIELTGSRLVLTRAVASTSITSLGPQVPTNVSEWRGWLGSNQRPLASEANTLSTELQPRWRSEAKDTVFPDGRLWEPAVPAGNCVSIKDFWVYNRARMA
jgi:site-specific DNA recombinase